MRRPYAGAEPLPPLKLRYDYAATAAYSWLSPDAVDAGFLRGMCTVILWMKLVSYAHCNHDSRCAPPTILRQPPLSLSSSP